MNTTFTRLTALAAATIMTITACGSDENTSSNTVAVADTTHDTTHDTTDHQPVTVAIGGVDYAFTNVPASTPAGTTLELQNTSEVELHELVAFRLPDSDELPLAELVQLPPDELTARLGAPVTVVLQAPGSDEQIVAVGDGSLQKPGRYVIMCFIPTGVDPQVYFDAAAASNGAPPAVPGGPPHFVNGMYAELVVEPLN
ncbi:MAG TPA: hypothetical protein VES40_10175 [Ilumatobacteraceae bacterium]|nr:hypothetical protein [Ilumatobacteraceae bacterium]